MILPTAAIWVGEAISFGIGSSPSLNESCRLQGPSLKAAEIQQRRAIETLGMDDPVERLSAVGGEVPVELDGAADDFHRIGAIHTAGEGGREIGEGESLGTDEYLIRQTVKTADEVGGIRRSLVKGRSRESVGLE